MGGTYSSSMDFLRFLAVFESWDFDLALTEPLLEDLLGLFLALPVLLFLAGFSSSLELLLLSLSSESGLALFLPVNLPFLAFFLVSSSSELSSPSFSESELSDF